MADRPLIISASLIPPTRQGVKTCTRRLNGLEVFNKEPNEWKFTALGSDEITRKPLAYFVKLGRYTTVKCPYGNIGDVLFVRENWYVGKGYDDIKPIDIPQLEHVKRGYPADGPKPGWAGRTRPSIHIPKWLSRIRLEITHITVERLHDITEKDAEAEGVERGIFREGPNTEKGEFHLEHNNHATHRDGFKFIWMQLNGRDSWNLNPHVWVIKFKLLPS